MSARKRNYYISFKSASGCRNKTEHAQMKILFIRIYHRCFVNVAIQIEFYFNMHLGICNVILHCVISNFKRSFCVGFLNSTFTVKQTKKSQEKYVCFLCEIKDQPKIHM